MTLVSAVTIIIFKDGRGAEFSTQRSLNIAITLSGPGAADHQYRFGYGSDEYVPATDEFQVLEDGHIRYMSQSLEGNPEEILKDPAAQGCPVIM